MKRRLNLIPLALIIFLLTTNLATIVSYRLHLAGESKLNQYREEIPDKRMGPYLRDALNLSEEQSGKFRDFRREYNRSANDLLVEMQRTRDLMVKQLNKVNPDRSELDKLAKKLGDQHVALKDLTFDYYFKMQSTLNQEQQAEMVDIFQSLLTAKGDVKTPGHESGIHEDHSSRGGGYGRRSTEHPVDTSDMDNTFHEFE